jgi:hypothetical protein
MVNANGAIGRPASTVEIVGLFVGNPLQEDSTGDSNVRAPQLKPHPFLYQRVIDPSNITRYEYKTSLKDQQGRCWSSLMLH